MTAAKDRLCFSLSHRVLLFFKKIDNNSSSIRPINLADGRGKMWHILIPNANVNSDEDWDKREEIKIVSVLDENRTACE